jgi:hypothetical protein
MRDDGGIEETKRPISWRSGVIVFLVIFMPIGYFNWYSNSLVKPYHHPRFLSGPYHAPLGCIVKKYEVHDYISRSCYNEKYAFYHWKDYGLEWFGRFGQGSGPWSPGPTFGNYYRVGNDLLGIQCGLSKRCYITGVERDVYIAPQGSK